MRIGPTEILIIVLIVALLFGVGKIPQVGEAIGKGINSFRKGARGEEDTKKKAKKSSAKKASTKKAPVAAASGEAAQSEPSVAMDAGQQVEQGSEDKRVPETSA